MNKTKGSFSMQAPLWTRARRHVLALITGFTVLIERRFSPLPAR